jgi:putative pyrroloquinoline-quinone-binding quinoprotein
MGHGTLLVAGWSDGVFSVSERGFAQELSGCSVRALTTDGRGGTLAVVGGHTLRRRTSDGLWTTLTTTDAPLSCCVAAGGDVYVGTEDARVFRLNEKSELVALRGFDSVEGRETWTAGRALVNGQLMGPPLGVRSISATGNGVLLANVHVGGVPRSTDAGTSWHPTIAVETDVHEVRAHPRRPNVVAAAAAAGLCLSHDGGATWSVQTDGLHASYCSAVAFVDNDVLVAASDGHFAATGRIYRRSVDESSPARAIVDGLPPWTDGIVDTHCIAVSGSRVAFVDRAGNVYVSEDAGLGWSRWAHGLTSPSSIHLP